MAIKILFVFLASFGIAFAGPTVEPTREPEISSSAIVVFGATGDLASLKLFPALYNLSLNSRLPDNTAIVGAGRRDLSNQDFRKLFRSAVDKNLKGKVDEDFWKRFEGRISYHKIDVEKDDGYIHLNNLLRDQKNRIYYLATQPSSFSSIVQKLSDHGLIYDSKEKGKWSRVVIEKPFGRDLNSAETLQKQISDVLDESQIYRIDHFLGKEGIQNFLSFRFKEGLFEPIWNRRYIDQVQITIGEDIGIGNRARFWEETGLVRDLIQNHMMQILSLAAMDPPASLDSEKIHAEKIKLLNAVRLFPNKEIDRLAILGQYDKGEMKGAAVPGYRQENGVPAESSVETFAAAKIYIDNDRWEGVPFYLRAGKRLPEKTTEIAIFFKGLQKDNGHALFIRIQPEPAIYLRKMAAEPNGPRPLVRLDAPSEKPEIDAYEKLLEDCFKGDASLFVQADEQIASWKLWTPFIQYASSHPPQPYSAGTWGPKAAEELAHWEILNTQK